MLVMIGIYQVIIQKWKVIFVMQRLFGVRKNKNGMSHQRHHHYSSFFTTHQYLFLRIFRSIISIDY